MTPELAEVFQLMAEGPSQRPSFAAHLVVSAEEEGALQADRREREREHRQNPEMIEQPPMRRRLSGQWSPHISVQEGKVSLLMTKDLTTPAGSPGISGEGALELMLRPWRLLAGYQLDERVGESVVAGRACWLLRGSRRVVEPLFDPFVGRWARATDSTELAIDKEKGNRIEDHCHSWPTRVVQG